MAASFDRHTRKTRIIAALQKYDRVHWGGELERHLLRQKVRLPLARFGTSMPSDAWASRTIRAIASEFDFHPVCGEGEEDALDLSDAIDLKDWKEIGRGGTGMVYVMLSQPSITIKIWRRDSACPHWRREYELVQQMHSFLSRRPRQVSGAVVHVMEAYQFQTGVDIRGLDAAHPDRVTKQCVLQVQRIYEPHAYQGHATQAMLGESNVNTLTEHRGRLIGVKQLTELFGEREQLVQVVRELGALVAALQLDGCFDLVDTELVVGNTTPNSKTTHLYLIDFDQSNRYDALDYHGSALKQLASNLSRALEAVAYYPMRQVDEVLFDEFWEAYIEEGEKGGYGELAQLVMDTYDRNTTVDEDDYW